MRPYLAVLIGLILVATTPALAQDKSVTPPITVGSTSPVQAAASVEEGWVLELFFDGAIQKSGTEEAKKFQDNRLNWVRFKAQEAGVQLDEFNIRDTKPRADEKYSPKEVFETIPKSAHWRAFLTEDADVIVRRVKTQGGKTTLASAPLQMGGPLDPRDALDGLLKPVKLAIAKKAEQPRVLRTSIPVSQAGTKPTPAAVSGTSATPPPTVTASNGPTK